METKICRECKRELLIDQFELEHTKNGDRRRVFVGNVELNVGKSGERKTQTYIEHK